MLVLKLFLIKMIKYKDSYIVFEEIPNRVSLALNITNCQNMCPGCHSPELRLNNGIELTNEEIDRLINENYGINCVLFMGEGRDYNRIIELASYIKDKTDLKVAIYSGRDNVEKEYFNVFDYVKVGAYKEEFGPLNSKETNQRLYEINGEEKKDITHLFWK
jgi:anaerobic ribonucleoside-triphosphate reductase activating protein